MKSRKTLAVMGVLLASFMGASLVACAGTPGNTEQPQVKEYTVTFDANGGTLTGNSTVKIKEGDKITGAPTAAKAEHTFEAWYDAATGGTAIVLTTYTVSKDVTLYAHYTANTPAQSDVKITFDANGGKFDGDKTTIERTPDEDNLVLDADEPVKTDYRFLGWYTAATGGEEVDPMFDAMTESKTLYAQWIRQYTVTFNAGDGTLEGSATLKVDENAKIVGAPTAKKAGNGFYGWYTAAEGGDKIDLGTYTVGGDVTLHARFGEHTMPIKTLKSHEGTVVGYRIEAEEAVAEGTQNSDNQAHPGTFLEDVRNASGGHSLGYLGKAGNTVTFTFKAAAAGKARLYFFASSGNVQMDFSAGFVMWGADQQLTGNEFDLTFNNAKVNYEAVMVKGATKEDAVAAGGFAFNTHWTRVPVCEVDLVAGTNTFILTVKGETACNLDCLDVETTVALTSVNGDAVSGESTLPVPPAPDVVLNAALGVKLVIGAYDGGPALQKAIIDFGENTAYTQAQLDGAQFAIGWGGSFGGQNDKFVLSNANGEAVTEGTTTSRYATITYTQTFNQYGVGNSVFVYDSGSGVNRWKDLNTVTASMKGTLTVDETTYNKLNATVTATKEVPALDKWNIDGTYTYTPPAAPTAEGDTASGITLKYATHTPSGAADDDKENPLIIWLHGQGEGGAGATYTPVGQNGQPGTPIVFDNKPDIALLGNKVTALAEEGIQKYFKAAGGAQGAYVLVPQSPTMWMDYDGNWHRVDATHGTSYYLDALWNLIQTYVTGNTDIDTNRIYIGGCSNGGFMTMQMIEHHADYFAAAFPIATPYSTSDALIESIKNLPIWFVHSKDDTTVSIGNWRAGAGWWEPSTFESFADANTNAIYLDLIANATAKDHVWYTLTENVKGDNNTAYAGHYSWIYVFNDQVSKVQAKAGAEGAAMAPTDLDPASTATVGENVTLWSWIAAQAKTATPA